MIDQERRAHPGKFIPPGLESGDDPFRRPAALKRLARGGCAGMGLFDRVWRPVNSVAKQKNVNSSASLIRFQGSLF
jgi:hypothetical protein